MTRISNTILNSYIVFHNFPNHYNAVCFGLELEMIGKSEFIIYLWWFVGSDMVVND